MIKGKKIKKIIGTVILAIFIAFVLCAFVVSLINKTKGKTTFIFGYSVMWVETGSMEPTIPEKSYILVKKYGNDSLAVGDVITFICPDKDSKVFGRLITHRITAETEDGYKTKGDYDYSLQDDWTVTRSDIIAVYSKNLQVLTFFGRIFTSYVGLALIIVVFLASCIFIYIPDMIDALKDEERIKAEKEKELERRVREEVKKMQQKDIERGINEKDS